MPTATSALGDYFNMTMAAAPGHTYRYNTVQQLWTFGFGMSYTTFAYSDMQLSAASLHTSDTLTVTVALQNVGTVWLADEVVQLYIANPLAQDEAEAHAGCRSVPLLELKAFTRVRTVAPGETRAVTLSVAIEQLVVTNADCVMRVVPGTYTLWVGGRQPGVQGEGEDADTLGAPARPLQATFKVVT